MRSTKKNGNALLERVPQFYGSTCVIGPGMPAVTAKGPPALEKP
jgi:hypothetical protein